MLKILPFKALIISLWLFISLFIPLLGTENGPLFVGYIDLKPHIFSTKAGPRGLFIDFLEKKAPGKWEKIIRLEPVPFKRSWEDLKSHRIDGFLTLMVNEERKKVVRYLDGELIHSQPLLVIDKRKSKLINKKIAHVSGTIIPSVLTKSNYSLFPIHGADFIYRSVKMLETQRVDGVYHPECISLVTELDKKGFGKYITAKPVGRPYHIRVGVYRNCTNESSVHLQEILNSGQSYFDYSMSIIKIQIKSDYLRQFIVVN